MHDDGRCLAVRCFLFCRPKVDGLYLLEEHLSVTVQIGYTYLKHLMLSGVGTKVGFCQSSYRIDSHPTMVEARG
jgi:hypothetical protein